MVRGDQGPIDDSSSQAAGEDAENLIKEGAQFTAENNARQDLEWLENKERIKELLLSL